MRPAFAAIALAIALGACATRAAFVPPPAELPASTACAPAIGLSDSDSDNDLAAVDPALLGGLCASVTHVSDIGRTWVIQRFQSGRPGPLWVVPHDDENSAFASAIAAVHRHGGILVAVDNNGARTNASVDPNRVFGSAGRCHGDGSGPVAAHFTREMLRYRFAGQPIIALHSNLPGYDGDGAGGGGNTSILFGGRHRTPYAAAAPYPGSVSPADTLVFMAGLSRRPDQATAQTIARLNGAGVNVMYEHVSRLWTDCSLSNFALLSNLGPYINIETVDGDVDAQIRLIDDVMRVLTPAVAERSVFAWLLHAFIHPFPDWREAPTPGPLNAAG